MKNIVDFDKLEKELQEAVREDVRRQQVNDTKLRAMHEKVASYEEFEQRVKAAHLRPLSKDEIQSKPTKTLWTVAAEKRALDLELNPPVAVQSEPSHKRIVPKSVTEFEREWRKTSKDPHQRCQFFLSIETEDLKKIFKTEVNSTVLGDVLVAFNTIISDSKQVSVFTSKGKYSLCMKSPLFKTVAF
eukprot:Colp12_sorted_trinity150504_noHs@25806